METRLFIQSMMPREDFHYSHKIGRTLASWPSLYDDVLDYTYAAVNRLFLYEIDSPTEPMRRFADLVLRSVREIDFRVR